MKYPRAEQYHLIFTRAPSPSGPYPFVKCRLDENGNSQNIELAEFINGGGARFTKEIIDEVNSFNFDERLENNFISDIYSFHGHAEIFASPNRVSFWNGTGYINIPLQEFLDILQEWIDFLNSIPMVHYLSRK